MKDNQQPVAQHYNKADRSRKHLTSTGIGGGLVGAAIGGLLGRKVGGIYGTVVGTVAGALLGKGTAQRVNHTLDALVEAAKSVADGVNHSVKDVGDAIKDTVEEAKPSVVGVVNTVKDTVDEIKPSVVGTVKNLTEGFKIGDAIKDTVEEVKPSVVGIVNSVKDTVEEVKPSVIGVVNSVKDTVEEVKPSVVDTLKNLTENFKTGDAIKDTVEEVKPSVVGVVNSVKDTVEEVTPSVVGAVNSVKDTVDEVTPKPETIKTGNKNLQRFSLIVLGAAIITGIGAIFSFSQKPQLSATKSPETPPTLSTKSPQTPPTFKSPTKTIADGWIFLGNVNKNSASNLAGKSFVKNSQSINSSIVPAVNSIATVNIKSGVSLRKNRPQKPNLNYQQKEKALAIVKPREKLKILKVEAVTNSQTNKPVTQVWAQVQKCKKVCK
jgi:hypothetical protein